MQYIKKKIDNQQVKALARQYRINLLTASILLRRGVSPLYYLEDKELFLHNPFLLTDIDEAVSRILMALEEGEQIMVFGDRDTDGVTATTIMAEYLIKKGASPTVLVPTGDDSYGLTTTLVEQAKQQGITLIICLDNGSTAFNAVAVAKTYGIDVVVFDHHNVSPTPLEAYAFVNPKRDTQYPNPHLSTSALMLKALFALNFAEAGLMNRPVCLLNVYLKDNNEMDLTVCRVVNLKMGQSIPFNLGVDGSEKFLRFLEGCELFVYKAEQQVKILETLLGAEVFVTDLAQLLAKELGDATVLNLNQLKEKSKMFRFNNHATLMDTLFVLYKLSILRQKELFTNYYGAFDLACIGLLSDMMRLEDENRIIVKKGLSLLNQPTRSSLTLLLNHLKLLNNNVTTKSIGWKIGPFINGAGRMGQADKMLNFLLNVDNTDNLELLNTLEELNQERKKLSENWWQSIWPLIEQSKNCYKGRLIFICKKELPRGIMGLLANRISRTEPHSLVIVATERNNEEWVASLRANQTGLIATFFKQTALLLLDYGGHDNAGGFSIPKTNMSNLKTILEKLPSLFPLAEEDEQPLFIDAELTEEHLNRYALEVVKRFEPYGQGFNELIFASNRVVITDIQLVGKASEHLKLSIALEGVGYTAFWWGATDNLKTIAVGQNVYLIYTIVIDNEKSAGFYFNIKDIQVLNV